jgi:hypothetical protein
MGGMHYQEIPREFTATQINRLNLEEKQRDTSGKGVRFSGEHHLYGYNEHQDYNYLGPGTQYKKRQALGIEPINDLDRIAMYHDRGYSLSDDYSTPAKALSRGFHDLGAGAAMITASVNPWSDAPFAMSVICGVGLTAQGFLRVLPGTSWGMALVDYLVY